MFPLALKIIAMNDQRKEIGSHTMMAASLSDFSRPIQSHMGSDRKDPYAGLSFENLPLIHGMILGAIYLAPVLLKLRPLPVLKVCDSLTKGHHCPVSHDPEAVSQVFPSYSVASPPHLEWLPRLPFQKLQNLTSLFGFHRENYYLNTIYAFHVSSSFSSDPNLNS